MSSFWKILLSALREIFDEAPYGRFLQRTGMKSSPAAYALFLRESEQVRNRRPRCC